ncbi:serine hydrolase domain-containing protein [Spongiivirga citrea]|uniref:Serine hydrolase n=1 Tax=Spongiivirga citrea TaxID=1481457 RepID=A0A6M0CLG4_9FLAO|nr:serine hydrolase domain-containing protein [Spongiivirga citrea]NER18776.1 serine hydrolase [Spongiivirga citrea]
MRKNILLFSLFIFSICQLHAQKTLSSEFDLFLSKEFKENEPGGSLLIQKGGNILFLKSYGISDIETGEKNTENTIYNTGSISKTMVANGILILAERNLLSLDDTLLDHFPDFEDKALAKSITLKNLLSHTSGIPDLRDVRNNPDFYLTAKDTANFEPLKAMKKLNFEPGYQFQYSNPCYNGLALIIEKVAKQPWQDFIVENVFKPSGMSRSKITNGSYPSSDVAHAYVVNRGKYEESDYGEVPTFAAAGNGGIWSTVQDLAKYELAHKNATFLSSKYIEKSRTVHQPDNWGSETTAFLGYGWMMDEIGLLRRNVNITDSKIVHHTGSQGGFRAFHISIPDQNIIFIALFNRPVKSFREIMVKGFDLMKAYGYLK